MSTTSFQASSTSRTKFHQTRVTFVGIVLLGLLSGCVNEPGIMTFSVANKFLYPDPSNNGLCTGGLRAKLTTSNGTVLEIPSVAPGKDSFVSPTPTTPYGLDQTITVEAWCNTGGGVEGYSKYSRKGSSAQSFGASVNAPGPGTAKRSYEIVSPGPVIGFDGQQPIP
jgi:hypothetical protein